ncbi:MULTISPECIES: glycosyltransferase [unclassified Luteimonas]|uniref:glycosyltransferase n=1 Tax=unclassified Luteimonas TaxID=2629088 RepID=UPI0018F0A723|nr:MULTISPECIES: glycosyltransferase [unclassified Luteimonas]MBJ6978553.1 glycosyltransferase [Luteimonas sp. MC1895]MBJ6983450.1 glycosyltransferase [Luteimonas sp. MC1750]QQO06302.1 glycosyltransferase [Luteimonas sp. MC1750]
MSGWPAGRLLVSSVNGGGVFAIVDGAVERWSHVDTTGIALLPGGALLARQAEGRAELRWLRGRDAVRVQLVERSLDLHDVLWHDGRVYVVATQLNAVFEFDHAFTELRHWAQPGEEDAQHVNSCCVHQGRLLASRFGTFHAHRGYKGATRGAGEVYDVETGEVMLRGLSQPHSLLSDGDRVWLCDSEARTLRCYRGFEAAGAWPLDGYVRGLAIADGVLYVGLSRSRNAEPGAIAQACVVAFDLADMSELGRIELPANEVYDLRVPDAAAMDDLRAAAFADAVAEYETQVDARNRAVEAVRREADATGLATALHEANLRIAALEATEAAQAKALAEATRARARLSVEALEEGSWRAILEADALALRTLAADQAALLARQAEAGGTLRDAFAQARDAYDALAQHHAGAVAAHSGREARLRDLLAAQQAFIEQIVTSRSWRWMRSMRSAAPEPPAMPQGVLDPPAAQPTALPRFPADDVIGDAPAAQPSSLPSPPARADLPIADLAFDVVAEPTVSIVVAAHGQFAATRACLESIRDAGAGVPFEVILVEDASGEPDMDRFARVPGLRYHRHPANLGFLRSMNAALPLVRAAFVHFLNNDTLVTPGWLDGLLLAFQLHGACGLAGSRLVYPDGRLQEAGGIVWSDGDGCNVGRGGDPADPAHAAVREVDYVSGASILLRTQTLRDVGGFDERYAPAYYEDTDLAFRLREHGIRTFYQPWSTVVHQEGLSHGTDAGEGGKAWQAENRVRFFERWAAILERDQLPRGQHPFLARSRAQRKKLVLVADRHLPRTDQDAGSRAMWQLMRLLQERGFELKFWSHAPDPDPRARDLLLMHGIEIVGEGLVGFDDWLNAHGACLDYALLSRPHVADALVDAVRRRSSARVVYYGHDVHHLRLAAQHALEPSPALGRQVVDIRRLEEGVWARVDAVLYPAEAETRHVQAWRDGHGAAVRALTVPLFAYGGVPERLGEAERLGARDSVLFVGGFAHAPNADAVAWFLAEAWPHVRAACPGLRMVVAGADPGPEILAFAGPDVEVTGALTEEDLMAAYARARVAVAPLRFGAGVKGKVLESLRHGVPCVTTTVGAQGLEDAEALRVADQAEAFAHQVAMLAGDDAAWRNASEAGLAFIRTRFSESALWSALSTVMDATPYPDVDARLAAIAAAQAAAARR